MVALVASVSFPYVVVIAAGRELPKTPAGRLCWVGVGVVLALVARGLGEDSDMRTRGELAPWSSSGVVCSCLWFG